MPHLQALAGGCRGPAWGPCGVTADKRDEKERFGAPEGRSPYGSASLRTVNSKYANLRNEALVGVTAMTSDPPPTVHPAWRRKGTLYVIGIDGLTSDVIAPMADRGELPHLARLAREGSCGSLKTIWPTLSSMLWPTIATGRHYRDHGIDHVIYHRLLGRRVSHHSLRKGRHGTKQLLRALRALGLMRMRFFDSRDVRAKTFWEIVSEAGGRAGVINWWHTWPATPLNGFVVSDRLLYWRQAMTRQLNAAEARLTFPDELLDPLRKLITSPEDVSAAEIRRYVNLPERELAEFLKADFKMNEVRGELRFFIAADQSCRRILDFCLTAFPDLQVIAAYFRGPDIAQHCAFQYAPWAQSVEVSAEERERFGEVVPQAYRQADELVGEVLARMRAEDTLLVVSDHGFAFVEERRAYGHKYAEPPGVLYAYGKEFRQGGRLEGASLYDVAPTVLRVCGFPPARDMQGRCLEEILTPEFSRKHPPLDPVDSYGPRHPSGGGAKQPATVTRDIKDHLRGLGYLD